MMVHKRDFVEQLFTDGVYEFDCAEKAPEWSVSASGDICFIHGVKDRIEAGNLETMFHGISEILQADIVYGNLETPLTKRTEVNPAKKSGIRSEPEHFAAVASLGFNLFCLGNNHVLDFQAGGLADTIKLLDEKDISHAGAGMNLAEARKPAFLNANGVKVGMISYCQPEANAATETEAGVAPLRSQLILEDLAQLKAQVDLPILSLHEGFEFGKAPRLEHKYRCHRYAEAGAKLIFSHHPHVPHGIEYHSDCLIFYSLGNFLFDYPYHRSHEWTRKNFVPRIFFSGTELKRLEIHPIELSAENELFRCRDEKKQYVLDYLKEISSYVLSDEKIESENRPIIERIMRGIMTSAFNHGKNNSKEEFDFFFNNVVTKCDPYMKALRDFVKYQLEGESIADF
ncbi:CapA family protein [Candidatus Poribacteria bacterium]